LPNEDLLNFVKTGNPSTAFLTFLADLTDKKLEDFDKKINLSFNLIQEISIESTQSVLERLMVL
jgi:hypothetical protein